MRSPADAPRAASPLPPVTRGERHCDACAVETPHTSTRVISAFGRRMILGAVALAAVMWAYFFLAAGLDRPLALAGNGFLTLIIAAALIFLGARRQEYRVVCERCGHTATRLSAPVWTRPLALGSRHRPPPETERGP